ncbi:hypothetical protein QWY85_06750 [Neolewinella lacunae]|uniref:Uncharacterized protein n=1 Tax=Neolewinella lacunae TaxID=1517758 RepID=A0A923T792_9BACT|nr:hypothetical protein [Neolewinella lacunae]MBC6992608.1 hypothetical protein [Neolewinella lacunae]MDN3634349.1 hypothetical protein [Neolewinella lacunae]
MEATCKTCNHWEHNAPAVQNRENFGECEVLSESGMKFVLPVLQSQSATAGLEFITNGDFGCNQYES